MMQITMSAEDAEAATFVIDLDFSNVPRYGLSNFSRGRSYIELGERAAEAALPRLQTTLPWLKTLQPAASGEQSTAALEPSKLHA
jgi:hypothetical protein